MKLDVDIDDGVDVDDDDDDAKKPNQTINSPPNIYQQKYISRTIFSLSKEYKEQIN